MAYYLREDLCLESFSSTPPPPPPPPPTTTTTKPKTTYQSDINEANDGAIIAQMAIQRRIIATKDVEPNSQSASWITPTFGLSHGQKNRLLSYKDIPSWYQDNEYIHFGYRSVSNSANKCFSSLLYPHNETFNIYSHLLSAFVFLAAQGFMINILSQRYPDAKVGDYLVLSIFLATAFVTLMLSSLYHTMCNHSQKVCSFWLRMDFTGILLLNIGDFVSGIYLVFFCDRKLQIAYWTMTLSLGTISAILVVHPRLQGLRWRTFRVSAFVCTGLTGFIPLAHGLVRYGWDHMWIASGMPYYVLEGGLLVIGAVFYSTRFPEMKWPGKFDVWGSSHNIFHVLAVLATAVHLVGIGRAYDWNYHNSACRI